MLDINPLLLGITIVVFLILIAVLNSLLFKPLFNYMEERDADIKNDQDKVGNNDADWRIYGPYDNQPLEDILDLSELEEMDFSILVTKFPAPDATYDGEMWLSATQAEFRQCWD